MPTIPSMISAWGRPDAAQFLTWYQAIVELQAARTYSYTWITDGPVEEILLENIPADLSTLRLTAVASSDSTALDYLGLHCQVNSYSGLNYAYRKTVFNGADGTARAETVSLSSQNNGLLGIVESDLYGGFPCGVDCVFANWGNGALPLTWTSHSSNYSFSALVGGQVALARPYTSLRLIPGLGGFKAGSSFTLSGSYQ